MSKLGKNGLARTSLILTLFLAATPAVASLTARQIMEKNEEARKVTTVESKARLTTSAPGKEAKIKEFSWSRKLGPEGTYFKTFTRFHAPAEVRGEGILFLEGAEGDNDIQMYLPAFKKIRRVETQQQSGNYMGSEFSYSDIASPHVEDHEYKVLREEACPGPEAAGVKCWVIESTPVSEKILDRTGYAKMVNWIRQDNYMGVQGEYADKDGQPWKKLQASKILKVDPAKGKWMAHVVRIENVKSQRATLLEFSDVKANAPIAESVFTAQNLSRAN